MAEETRWTSRKREFQAGAIFHRIGPELHPMAISPWSTLDGGQQEIKVSSLIATQKSIDPKRVQHYVDNPHHDPIDVLRGGTGKPFIYDGHHRAAAAKIRGQKTITANVRKYG